jgi:hypothetical protein
MDYALIFMLLVAIGLGFVPSRSSKIRRTVPRKGLMEKTDIPTEVEVRG